MPSGDQSLEGIAVGVAVVVLAKTIDKIQVWRQRRPRVPKTMPVDERIQLQREWAELRAEVRRDLEDCRGQHEECRAENSDLRGENTALRHRIETLEQWKRDVEEPPDAPSTTPERS